MVQLMSGLLRLKKKFQNSLLLDHVVKTTYQRAGALERLPFFGWCLFVPDIYIYCIYIFIRRVYYLKNQITHDKLQM